MQGVPRARNLWLALLNSLLMPLGLLVGASLVCMALPLAAGQELILLAGVFALGCRLCRALPASALHEVLHVHVKEK